MWYANGMNKDYYIDGGFTKFDNTDSNGAWSLSKNAGWYTINSWKSGFYDGYVNVFACGNQPNQNNSLRIKLNEGEMSILLTWPTTNPVTGTDLDSHLYIPIIDIDASRTNSSGDCDGDADRGDKCHLNFRTNQLIYAVYKGVTTNDYHIYGDNSTGDNVTLDRDLTTNPGDENTTISKVRSGTYSFSVHDYTNKGVSSSDSLPKSRAKVRVWYNKAGTLIQKTFHPPNANGTLWRVFTFNSSDSGSGFTRVRTMTNQNTRADVY